MDIQEECKFFYKNQENITPTPHFIRKYSSFILSFVIFVLSILSSQAYIISQNIQVLITCFLTNFLNIILYGIIRNYFDDFENFEFTFLEDKFIFKFEPLKEKEKKNLKAVLSFSNLDSIKLTKNFLGQDKLELKGNIFINYEPLTTNKNVLKMINTNPRQIGKASIPFSFKNKEELKKLIEKYQN